MSERCSKAPLPPGSSPLNCGGSTFIERHRLGQGEDLTPGRSATSLRALWVASVKIWPCPGRWRRPASGPPSVSIVAVCRGPPKTGQSGRAGRFPLGTARHDELGDKDLHIL